MIIIIEFPEEKRESMPDTMKEATMNMHSHDTVIFDYQVTFR
jgi:hypothetical protein